jgi:hypothetical protein
MMDQADIGGAASQGRPVVPDPTTVEYDENGDEILEPMGKPVAKVIPDAVQRNVMAGTDVAYPDAHPAASGRFQLDPKGNLIVGKGQIMSRPNHEASIDILTNDTPREVKPVTREEKERALDAAVGAQAPAVSAVSTAKNEAGAPLTEVVFHTPYGASVYYYHKAQVQNPWLILVSDNSRPAQPRFFPKPFDAPDGSKGTLDVVITGADKRQVKFEVVPLGLQFTIDSYDFCVLMIKGE